MIFTSSELFFAKKPYIFKKKPFFYEKKLYFFIGRGILLVKGRKMPVRHWKDSHIKRQDLTLLADRWIIHWKRDISRLMEIFINKTDTFLSEPTAVDPGGQPFFFIKC